MLPDPLHPSHIAAGEVHRVGGTHLGGGIRVAGLGSGGLAPSVPASSAANPLRWQDTYVK